MTQSDIVQQTCANCGRPIGQLESAHSFGGHQVCGECLSRLAAAHGSSSTAPPLAAKARSAATAAVQGGRRLVHSEPVGGLIAALRKIPAPIVRLAVVLVAAFIALVAAVGYKASPYTPASLHSIVTDNVPAATKRLKGEGIRVSGIVAGVYHQQSNPFASPVGEDRLIVRLVSEHNPFPVLFVLNPYQKNHGFDPQQIAEGDQMRIWGIVDAVSETEIDMSDVGIYADKK